MYEEGQPSGIGIVAFFPARDSRPAYVRHAHGSIPESTLRRIFDPHKRQYIGQTEILAALAAYSTLAADIRGSQVIHFIDNTSALAALVNGYSGAPDSMSMVHAFAEMRLALQVDAWLQWVPSKANIADLPSRGEFHLLHRLRSRETPLVLPDMEAFAHPIGAASALALRLPAEFEGVHERDRL